MVLGGEPFHARPNCFGRRLLIFGTSSEETRHEAQFVTVPSRYDVKVRVEHRLERGLAIVENKVGAVRA